MEKQIADMVKHLREQHYPVFSEDVIQWAEEAIEGTEYAKFFPTASRLADGSTCGCAAWNFSQET